MKGIAPILRAGVSAMILATIVSRISVDEVVARAAGAAPRYLAAALALSVFGVVLVAMRWRLLACWLGLKVPAGLALRALFVGVFGGQVLPSALGTDMLRGWVLARHTSAPSRVVASLLADRLVALFAACLLALFSSRSIELLVPSHAALVAPAAVLGSGGALLAFVAGLPRRMQGVATQPKPIVLALAIALAVHTGTVMAAALSAAAYGIDSSLGLWICVIPLSVIASALPISLNGWGVREAAIVVLAAPLGVPAVEALLVSVTLGVLNTSASLPGAVLMLKAHRRALV